MRGSGRLSVAAVAAVVLAASLTACYSADSTAGRAPEPKDPAVSTTVRQAEPITEIRSVRPFAGEGLRPGLRLREGRGWCWNVSGALPTRTDTWHCAHGNRILDPCFSSATSSYLICLRSPWDTTGTKLSLTKPLPASRPPLRPVLEKTWAFELLNGQRCLFAGGATFVAGGLRLNYICNGGYVYGDIDKTRQRWRVFFRLKGSQTKSRVEVATAWI